MNEFLKILSKAISDFSVYGFDSKNRLESWTKKLNAAILKYLPTQSKLEDRLKKSLQQSYKMAIRNQDISMLKPKLAAELSRRIMASSNLIKMNRNSAINDTLQRFQGWATSIPVGGSDAVKKSEVIGDIKKSLSSLSFTERRVSIDQGHKLISSIKEITAEDNGAIAAQWESKWRQAGYDARKDHKERDSMIYTIRDNWAIQKGLMKVGKNGWTDDITKPGEDVFCRCSYKYIYSLRELPKDMLTKKGKDALEKSRRTNASS